MRDWHRLNSLFWKIESLRMLPRPRHSPIGSQSTLSATSTSPLLARLSGNWISHLPRGPLLQNPTCIATDPITTDGPASSHSWRRLPLMSTPILLLEHYQPILWIEFSLPSRNRLETIWTNLPLFWTRQCIFWQNGFQIMLHWFGRSHKNDVHPHRVPSLQDPNGLSILHFWKLPR